MPARGQSISSTTAAPRASCGRFTSVTYTKNSDKDVMRNVREHVAAFAAPQDARGARLVFMTFALWFGLFFLGSWIFQNIPLNTWWGLAIVACWSVLRMGSIVRSLLTQHEGSHNALFTRRWMNDWTGILSGMLVGIDSRDIRITHAQHHHLNGIEEEIEEDPNHTVLFSTKQWESWPRGFVKGLLRLGSEPFIYFCILAPPVLTIINHAWPHRQRVHSLKKRVVYIAARLVILPIVIGGWLYLATSSPAHRVAEVLIFHVALIYTMWIYAMEHVFDGAYRVPKAEYDRTAAAVQGSSYMPMPWWWRWATIGVEYHHIHHINARVPGYRMEECQATAPPGLWDAAGVRPLTAKEGFRILILSLWDPDERCYKPWPEWEWLDKLLLEEEPQQLVEQHKKLA